MLTQNHNLYTKLENTIKQLYFEIHAIYEPEGDEGFDAYYCAAVDLFREGDTYRVYFKLDENGNIEVKHLERWFFG